MGKYFGPSLLRSFTLFGRHGVEFFFALSGFIIVCAHARDVGRPARFRRYCRNRLSRIYPPYWIVFMGVVSVALLFPPTYSTVVPQDMWSIARSFFLIPHDPVTGVSTTSPVLVVGWTLQYEMLFYFLFGMFLLNRYLGASLIAAILVLHFWPFADPAFALSFFQADWLLIFLMGAMVAVYLKRNIVLPPAAAKLSLASGVLAIVGLSIMETLREDQPNSHICLYFGFASCLIIMGLVKLEDQGTVWGKSAFLQLLGAASYSIYLTHFPAISGLCTAAARIASHSTVAATVSGLVIAIAVVAAGVLFHLAVEAPLLRLLSRQKRPRAADGPAPALSETVNEKASSANEEPLHMAPFPSAARQRYQAAVVACGRQRSP